MNYKEHGVHVSNKQWVFHSNKLAFICLQYFFPGSGAGCFMTSFLFNRRPEIYRKGKPSMLNKVSRPRQYRTDLIPLFDQIRDNGLKTMLDRITGPDFRPII